MASNRTIGPVNPRESLDEKPTTAGRSTDHTKRLLQQQSKPVPKNGALGAIASAPGRWRLFRPHTAASFVLGLAILYLVYRRGFGLRWDELWANVASANTPLLVFAFTVFYCSFPIRALRWRVLLGNVGYARAAGTPMPSTTSLAKIMYLASFVNCVTIARLGDAYRGYLLKKAVGVSFAVTLGTVLAERLLDLIVLAAILSATVLVAFRGIMPPGVTDALVAGLILSGLGICGVLAMRWFRGVVERVLPGRLHAHYDRLEHGTVGAFKRVPLLIIYSVLGWIIEGSALYLTAAAMGAPVPIASALVVALVASLLTIVPLAPSGLGFTEAGIVLLLKWLGLDTGTAGAVALIFRIINYWSIVALGSILYVFVHNASSSRPRFRQAATDHERPAGLNDPIERREAPFGPRKVP